MPWSSLRLEMQKVRMYITTCNTFTVEIRGVHIYTYNPLQRHSHVLKVAMQCLLMNKLMNYS